MARPDPPRAPDQAAPRVSLFREMFNWMIVPFLLVWPLSVAATYLFGLSLANQTFDQALAMGARALSEQFEWPSAQVAPRVRNDLNILLPDAEVEHHAWRIDRADGQWLLGDKALVPPPSFAAGVGSAPAYFSTDIRNTPMRVAAVRRTDPALAEPVVVYLSEVAGRRSQLARDIMMGIVVPQLIVIPLMVLFLWVGLKRGMAPIARMSEALQSRTGNDTRALDAAGQPEEVVPLVKAFNALLARVEREGATQKRFIDNAAHQLRTPLAGIRMQAELAARQGDAAQVRESLTAIAAGIERTSHLVHQLLALARSEADGAIEMGDCDLAIVAKQALEAALPAARERDIELAIDVPAQRVTLSGHAGLLQELVANLVDNAIRYSTVGGHVAVRVRAADAAHGAGPGIEVEDDGPGIPEAERSLVFERFYRGIGNTATGSGIGLAIVREIAARHQAEVRISTLASGTGSRFTVQFRAG